VFDNGTTREFTGVLLNSPRAVAADPLGVPSPRYSGLVVRTATGVILNPVGQIEISQLPPGLISKPTLVWKLETTKPGVHRTEVAYQTAGLGWKSDYVAILNKDDDRLDLTSWVTLDNKSGAIYTDAALKLIAGHVHRVIFPPAPPSISGINRFGFDLLYGDSAISKPFKESSFAEYHLYTMQAKTTIRDKETKQLSLFAADNVPARKIFVYEPVARKVNIRGKKVNVKIEVDNSEKDNLGMPMPAGKVRVYKKDADGALQFIGEDNIDHTPRDEKVRLYIGDAFDLVGERRVMRNENISDHARRETIEVSLRNHKDTEVTIVVVEHPYGDWTVMSNNFPFHKKDSSTLEFPIKVPANGEVTLNFAVQYKY
jgi:hypothetical protein